MEIGINDDDVLIYCTCDGLINVDHLQYLKKV